MTLLFAVITSVGAWGFTYSASSGTAGTKESEGYAKLVDGSKTTKWCVTSLGSPTYIEFSTSEAIVPQGYILTTGNDTGSNPGRNPKSWVIKAKANSGDSWTTIATVTNDTRMPAANTTDCTFPINTQISTSISVSRFLLSKTALYSSCRSLSSSPMSIHTISQRPTWMDSTNSITTLAVPSHSAIV